MLFFNSWAVGTLVCCIFTILLFGYLALLKNKAPATRYLAVIYLGAFILDLGYLWSALAPNPIGAYHRFLTIPGVFIALVAVVQFAYHYPRNDFPREARVSLVIGALISLGLTGEFIFRALNTIPAFQFNGEVFNYPPAYGQKVGLFILVLVVWFLVVMIRKIRRLEGDERRAALQMTIAMLIPTFIPGLANSLMQSGALAYLHFQQVFVIATLLGYFAITIVFINNAVERTSFMTKIVGISLVTILLVVQALSTIVSIRSDRNYDAFHIFEARSFRTAAPDAQSSVAYIISFPLEGSLRDQARMEYEKAETGINLDEARKGMIQALAAREFEVRRPRAADLHSTRLYFAFHVADEARGRLLEVGYPYENYRRFQDESSRLIAFVTIALAVLILILYPMFFARNLVRPLNTLITGVGEVNTGNLEVRIPVLVQDEIGYLSENFNSMVKSILDSKRQLQEHAENLELRVRERTAELKNTLDQVQTLKSQQDGDYYLTSIICRPLMTNWNKSQLVSTRFFMEQKKHFSFRGREAEVGGDVCVTGNLRFGEANQPERYIMFCNGDAMGKSMQGAGGAIVMGTALNNIMARSAGNDRVLAESPEAWLAEVYRELNDIFRTFDGSMTTSAVIGLINERTGRMVYFNAEHPWCVLYRSGAAIFLEQELLLRKLGSPSEFKFRVLEQQLQPGDVLFVGSDGRDDLELSPEAGKERVINEDHDLFRRIVEDCDGDLDRIVDRIKASGEVTDDFSLIRIGFQEAHAMASDIPTRVNRGKELLQSGDYAGGVQELRAAADLPGAGLAPLLVLGQAAYERRDYEQARRAYEECLELDASNADIWFNLSLCYKQTRQFEQARDAGERVRELQPARIANLVNLGDSYRLLGDAARARELIEAALKLDPNHGGAKKALSLLG